MLISENLPRFEKFAAWKQRIVFVLTFRCAEQFCLPNTQKQSKRGKNPEINRQSFGIKIQKKKNKDLSDIYKAVTKLKRSKGLTDLKYIVD